MDLPSSRPAALVRLPPVAASILAANSRKHQLELQQQQKVLNDDNSSEAGSSAHHQSLLSASTSTLGTVETAATEVTPPTSSTPAELVVSSKPTEQDASAAEKQKKKQKLAAEKRKRRREKKAAARVAQEENDVDEESDVGPIQEEAPVASTSNTKFETSTSLWSDDIPTALTKDVEELDFNELASAKAPSTSLSRRSSKAVPMSRSSSLLGLTAEAMRPASPAHSSQGWQEVSSRRLPLATSSSGKRNIDTSLLRPTSAFVKAPSTLASKDATWAHDKFDVWDQQRAIEADADNRNKLGELAWTQRATLPYLFNDPGSRLIVDDKSGKRKMTLRISLKPIPALLLPGGNKRNARQKAGAVEFDLVLHVEDEWHHPRSTTPLGEDLVIQVKLSAHSSAQRVPCAAARTKQEQQEIEDRALAEQQRAEGERQQAEQRRLDDERAEQERLAFEASEQARRETQAEAKRQRDEILATERARERVRVERELAEAEAERRSKSSMDILYTASPIADTKEAVETSLVSGMDYADASAQLRSVIMGSPREENASSSVPSIEEQMAEQDRQHRERLEQDQPLQHPPFYGGPLPGQFSFPPPPMGFPEPIMGPDGFPYFFDPVSGQMLPYDPSFFAPQPHPGYLMDMHTGTPTPSPTPPVSANVPHFFTPSRSRALEIKAPGNESRKSTHKSVQSRSTLQRASGLPSSGPVEEQVLPPGAFLQNGAVYFAPTGPYQYPPPMVSIPPPAPMGYHPYSVHNDPAILALSSSSSSSPSTNSVAFHPYSSSSDAPLATSAPQ